MQPTIVAQIADVLMTAQNVCYRLGRRFNAHGKAQRFMDKALTVVDRLPGKTDA